MAEQDNKPVVHFTILENVERYVESSGKFRTRCASFDIPGRDSGGARTVYLPYCNKQRFDFGPALNDLRGHGVFIPPEKGKRWGMEDFILFCQHFHDIHCPRPCRGYRNKTVAALFGKARSLIFGAKLHEMSDDKPSPPSFLKQAISAVPAVRYALGIGGVISVIAIVRGFRIDFRVALLGTILMLFLMTVLLVFAKAASRPQSTFKGPAFILTWFSLVLFIATATALFLSVFFGKPLDLRNLLAPVHEEYSPLKVTLGASEVSPQKIGTFKFNSPKEGWLPQWGQTPPDIVYGVTPGMDLGPAKGQYRFILAVRIEDPTIDRNEDTSIVTSAPYEIKNEYTKLAVKVGQAFMRRLNGGNLVSVSLLLMPGRIEPKQIHKLADVEGLGGALLATNIFQFNTITIVVPRTP